MPFSLEVTKSLIQQPINHQPPTKNQPKTNQKPTIDIIPTITTSYFHTNIYCHTSSRKNNLWKSWTRAYIILQLAKAVHMNKSDPENIGDHLQK